MKNPTSPDFETISNNIPGLWLWEKDVNSIYKSCNKQMVQAYGFSNYIDVIGKTDYQIPCKIAELAPTLREYDLQVISEKKTLKFFEVVKCANDQLHTQLVHKIPKFNKQNVVIGTIGHALDITTPYIKLGIQLSQIDGEKSNHPVQCGYRLIQEKYGGITLPKRQSECLFFYLRGRTVKEIGRLLKLSPKTIEYYIEIIKDKFGAKSKAELHDKAMESGFFNVIPESLFNRQLSLMLEE